MTCLSPKTHPPNPAPQAITQHGVYDSNLQPINPGTWVTSAGNGIKNCPKATSLTNLASVFTPSGGLVRAVMPCG